MPSSYIFTFFWNKRPFSSTRHRVYYSRSPFNTLSGHVLSLSLTETLWVRVTHRSVRSGVFSRNWEVLGLRLNPSSVLWYSSLSWPFTWFERGPGPVVFSSGKEKDLGSLNEPLYGQSCSLSVTKTLRVWPLTVRPELLPSSRVSVLTVYSYCGDWGRWKCLDIVLR